MRDHSITSPKDYAARHIAPSAPDTDDDRAAITQRARDAAAVDNINAARASMQRRRDEVARKRAEVMHAFNADPEPVTGGAAAPNRAARRASKRGRRKAGAAKRKMWCPRHETYHLVPIEDGGHR